MKVDGACKYCLCQATAQFHAFVSFVEPASSRSDQKKLALAVVCLNIDNRLINLFLVRWVNRPALATLDSSLAF